MGEAAALVRTEQRRVMPPRLRRDCWAVSKSLQTVRLCLAKHLIFYFLIFYPIYKRLKVWLGRSWRCLKAPEKPEVELHKRKEQYKMD